MSKEGLFTKIVNFMTPGAGLLVLGCGQIGHIVKIYYCFKNLLLYTEAYIRQTEGIVMIAKEKSTKIVNIHDPWGKGSCIGAWPYSVNAIFLLFLSKQGHESDKLMI